MIYHQLLERKESLEQALYLAESISERYKIDMELEQVESALADLKEEN